MWSEHLPIRSSHFLGHWQTTRMQASVNATNLPNAEVATNIVKELDAIDFFASKSLKASLTVRHWKEQINDGGNRGLRSSQSVRTGAGGGGCCFTVDMPRIWHPWRYSGGAVAHYNYWLCQAPGPKEMPASTCMGGVECPLWVWTSSREP